MPSTEAVQWPSLVGLEVQLPFSRYLVVDRNKTIETRTYALPVALLNVPIKVIQTPQQVPGTSALPDDIPAGDDRVLGVGTLTFTSCFQYNSETQWAGDHARHCVDTSGLGESLLLHESGHPALCASHALFSPMQMQ
jgi:hypothetical protein